LYLPICLIGQFRFSQKSFLTPAQDQAKLRQEERDAKSLRLPNQSGNCLNPTTTTGLVVTANVIRQMKVNETSLLLKKSAVQDNEVIANEKKVLAGIETKKLAKLVYEMSQ